MKVKEFKPEPDPVLDGKYTDSTEYSHSRGEPEFSLAKCYFDVHFVLCTRGGADQSDDSRLALTVQLEIFTKNQTKC